MEKENADIFAFQETKLTAPFKPAEVSGYFAYWSFSQNKKGYSGTLCLTKSLPLSVSYDMGETDDFDYEGRLITLEYPSFFFVNCYIPNSLASGDRYDYRSDWDMRFSRYIKSLTAKESSVARL